MLFVDFSFYKTEFNCVCMVILEWFYESCDDYNSVFHGR